MDTSSVKDARIRDLEEELKSCRERLTRTADSQDKFRSLVENSLAGFYIIRHGVFQYVNRRLVDMLGYDHEDQLLGMRFWLIAHPDDRDIVKGRGLRRERSQIEPHRYSFRALKRDGTQIWVEMSGVNSLYLGQPANVGNLIDISDLKAAEDALRQSEEKYRTILEAVEDGYYEVDLAGHVVFFTDAFTRIWGYSREELTGMHYRRFTQEKDTEKVYRTFNRVFTTGEPTKAYSWEIVRKDGSRRQVELSVSLIRGPQGEGVGFRGVARDITERKEVERELMRHRHHLEEMVEARTRELTRINEKLKQEITERRQVERRLIREKNFTQSVIDSLPGIFYVFDEQGRFLQWNRNLETLGNYSAAEVAGMTALDFYEGEDKRRVDERIREVFAVGRSMVEAAVLTKDGRQIPHLLTGVRVELDEGTYLVGIGVDITKRQLAEEALRQSERELRVLSSQLLEAQERERQRVAQELHDGIGQSLTAIKFGLEQAFGQMLDSPAAAGKLKNLIPMIQDAVEEVRRISMDLRPSTLDDLGVLATIAWFCREFERIYGAIHIDRGIDISEEGIPDRLKTVIYRVIQEALNNVAKHGRADRVRLDLRAKEGRVELTIQDNGVGFDLPEVLSSNSTKRGFGLASMRERTELSGGDFTITSRPGQGTRIGAKWPVGIAICGQIPPTAQPD